MRRIRIIDTHTEGEPTRVVVAGGPELGPGDARRRLALLRERHDGFRAAVVCEPRGSDAVVGALLLPASSPGAAAQVIFFNNVGYLGMCVHGTVGVVRTLLHLGRVGPGRHLLETPAGTVAVTAEPAGTVAVENVVSCRHAAGVAVTTEHHGTVRGDVAWGGNWFFLMDVQDQDLTPARAAVLSDLAWDVRCALRRAGATGRGGAEIDHVALFAPPSRPDADARSFVLCPGKVWDRSPCGTGMSAKMACLAADGHLDDGRPWRLESLTGGLFTGSVRRVAAGVVPTVRGRAFLTAEATLVVEADDPLARGMAA